MDAGTRDTDRGTGSPDQVGEENARTDVDDVDIEGSRPKAVDRYGFLCSDAFHQAHQLPPAVLHARRQKEAERTLKWVKMIKKWETYGPGGAKNFKLKRRVRKGIPDAIRGLVWYRMSDAEQGRLLFPDIDMIDTSNVPAQVIDEIGRDIDRTFPQHEFFIQEESPGQVALLRVLIRYAAVDPEVGYCQGMGFLAALFLTYMPEEQAFYCFHAVLARKSAPLRLFYLPRLCELQKALWVFGELGQRYLGPLWTHLSAEMMHPSMFFYGVVHDSIRAGLRLRSDHQGVGRADQRGELQDRL
mmetsp:Transcript_11856/g.26597  ORF Transcript_11856/g.26597 Transcript_11856/m.26597 type:complete len:300 (+) Transcript_11856:152-1051(+)